MNGWIDNKHNYNNDDESSSYKELAKFPCL